jgi:formylglycine-generating enzyme required for sulfatase activity
MKRILILVALSLFLCSTASTFQDGGGKPTKTPPSKPRPPAAPKPKVEPRKRSSTPSSGFAVTTPSGLKYLDEVVGTGQSPRPGQNVTVHYTGAVQNGSKFYSSVDRGQPFSFRIGTGSVIKGWDEGVMSMKVGGKRRLIIPPNLGYGVAGSPPKIPPNATVIFEVELLSVSADNTTPPTLPAPPAREEEERRALPKAPMNAANTKANPTAGIGALPVRGFEFDVVTVNSSGSETSRRKGQAQYCTEEIAGISLELVAIPGGTFVMGSTENDREKPPHQVTVGSFYMGKYEVTQAQWRAVARLPKVGEHLDSNRSHIKGDNLPVEQVSWEDAMEFCARLSRATGRTYRLPTEAEWEYACRAGTTTPFAFGQTITPQIVNYEGSYPYAQAPEGTYRQTTTPVGFLGVANGFGLFDMHGNVWEWCLDYWHENYNGAPTNGRSWETSGDTDRRVQRGGSWLFPADECRSAYRSSGFAGHRPDTCGFRVVVGARTP